MSGYVTLSSPDGSFVRVRPSDVECFVVTLTRDGYGQEVSNINLCLKSGQVLSMGVYGVEEAKSVVSFWEKEMEKIFN